MKCLSLKSALNAKLKDKELVVLEDLKVSSHKTKDFLKIIKKLKVSDEKVTMVVNEWDNNLKLASRNLKKVTVALAKDLTTHPALNCNKLIFTKNSLKDVEARIEKWVK